MINAALQYAELGYHVFPCAPDQKQPLPGSRGLLDATTDAEQIEAWWTEHPQANIAIRTDGLLVVDLDTLPDGGQNPWLSDQPEQLCDLAGGPLSLTPRGGRHYIFKQPAGKQYRNTAAFLAPNVDTRADGGYILAPPSVVDGRPYRWGGDLSLDCQPDSLSEPPGWLLALLDAKQSAGPSTRSNAVQANAIPSGQRNQTLIGLGGTMRRAGMGQGEIEAALLRANADRCNPPLPDAEVRKIAWSAAQYEPDQLSVALVENHYGQMGADAPAEAAGLVNPGPLPERLLHVPGFIADVIEYTLDTAPYPDRVLAFAGAVTLQAFLASRKVCDPSDARTSIFLLALASSGTGKDWPRKVSQKILMAAGLTDCVGDSFASGEGLEDCLLIRPAYLAQTDEIDGMLQAIKQGKDTRYEGIMNVLLKLYGSANAMYPMRLKAGKDQSFIDQPALTIFGTAIPKHCYEALSPKMLTNGFFARLLIVEAGKRGIGQDAAKRPLPDRIIAVAKFWAEFTGDGKGNLAAIHPTPRVIHHTPEAAAILNNFRTRMDREYSQAQANSDEATMAVIARANEKARRMSLNYACSENHQSPLITEQAAAWAVEIVEHLTRQMLFMVGAHVSENEFDSKCNRLLNVLRSWKERNGGEWMPFWKLSRRLKGWADREFEEVRKVLLGQGRIDFQSITHAAAGRPGEAYRLR